MNYISIRYTSQYVIVTSKPYIAFIDMVYGLLRDNPEYDELNEEEVVWQVLGDEADLGISVSKNHAEYVKILESDSHDEFEKLTVAYHLMLARISDEWKIMKIAAAITIDGGYWGVM